VIQLAHVASGALVGRSCTGVLDAFLAGFVAHGVMDVAPHGEVHDDRFELVTGALGIFALAARYGWRSPITVAAIGSVVPDMEHVPSLVGITLPPLYPTHRWARLHGWESKPLAIPYWLQALLGSAVIGALVMRRRHDRRGSSR